MAEKPGTSNVTIIDGSLDWSGGVNSNVVTTLQSERVPNGLKRNQVSWMDNATVRNGGITQRLGWENRGVLPFVGHYQGMYLYDPVFGNPYHIMVIGGHVWRVDQDNPSAAVSLSALFGLINPDTERVYFVQAEQFLVIQAGDFETTVYPHTLPLIWNGTTLRRSNGLTGDVVVTPVNPATIQEIPAATAMDYYMGRLWYAQGRQYAAGDIVGGPSGTPALQLKDSVLRVTENPLCLGGDGFIVPSNAGNIRAIKHSANINVQLGQGALYIATRKAIYSQTVPVTRTDWIGANNSNQPIQVVAQLDNGWVNDRSVTVVNSDMFGQSLEPAIRSFTASVRNFGQWGNVPISVNELRILAFNDRSLMRFSSGIYFDNRLLQCVLPFTTPVGVAHKSIIPLNFDVISTLEQQLPPCWEGMYEGLNVLEMTVGDFGGLERAFMSVWNDRSRVMEMWEFTQANRWDNHNDRRVLWYVEFPAFTWNREFDLKKLVGAELWIDKLLGEVIFKMEYRPDGDPCWYPWHMWKFCTAKDTCEDVHNPVCVYPQTLRESYRQTVTLPNPPRDCARVMNRPANVGYQFQPKLTIMGWCRIRGLLLHAETVDRKLYENMVCAVAPVDRTTTIPSITQAGPCSITTPSPLADGIVGDPYTASFSTTGGSGGFVFSITAGALPLGLTMNIAGMISGTPTLDGTYVFTVRAKDVAEATCSRDYAITINPAVPMVGFMVCGWAGGALPGLTYNAGCAASAFPAWNGIFDQTTNNSTGDPLWYFVSQSINGQKASADDSPFWPGGAWRDIGLFCWLLWNGTNWVLEFNCSAGYSWRGLGGAVLADPSGTYTRFDGSSATPATINIVAAGHPGLCP